jgi:hypothetical protein
MAKCGVMKKDFDTVLGDSTSSDIYRTLSRRNRGETSMLMLEDSMVQVDS